MPAFTKKDNNASYVRFQLKEYENIANAHFENHKQISLFVRYLLILYSALFLVLTLILGKGRTIKQMLLSEEPFDNGLLVIFLLGFWLSGIAISFYILHTKVTATLYARVVNGIRKYFWGNFKNNCHINLGTRLLPININKPKYFSKSDPLLISLIVLNSFYLTIILYLVNEIYDYWLQEAFFLKKIFGSFLLSNLIVIVLMCWFYKKEAKKKEKEFNEQKYA